MEVKILNFHLHLARSGLFAVVLALVLIALAKNATARNNLQRVIIGVVLRESNIGIPFANVLLLKASDSSFVKGSISDDQGNYSIGNVDPGNYLIQTHVIGFSKGYSSEFQVIDKDVTVRPIQLSESIRELEAVVVEADKPLFEQAIDRMIVNVESSPIMAGNTVLEILEKSPGIVVDWQNNSLSMNGKSGVSVMINGKMTRIEMSVLFGMLEGMSSNNIQKIELITSPPSNFDAEGNAGFINLVLKKNDYEGMNGSISGMIGKGRKIVYSTGGSINYRKEKLNIFSDFSISKRRQHGFWNINNIIQNEDYRFSSETFSDKHPTRGVYNGRAGLDFYLSPKTILGFLGTFTSNSNDEETISESLYEITPGLDTTSVGSWKTRENSNQYMMNVNFQHRLNKNQQLNLDLDYFTFKKSDFRRYSDKYFVEDQLSRTEAVETDKVTPLDIWVARADYSIDISDNFKWEVGTKATINLLDNSITTERNASGVWQVDQFFSDFTTMDENVMAAYTSFKTNLGEETELKAGLRYEHTLTDINDELGQSVVYRKYGNLFPTVFLTKSITKNSNINLAYSYRISRPSFSELAPFVLFTNPKMFVTGNTSLLPSLTHSIKSTYTVKGIIISLEYSQISDDIKRFQPNRVPDTDLIIFSSLNLDRTRLYNLSLSLPITVTNWWEMSNTITGTSNRITSQFYDNYIDIANSWFTINSTQSFILPKKYSIQLSGKYNSGKQNSVRHVLPNGMLTIGIRKEFERNLGSLSINYSDIFRTQISRWVIDTPELNNYIRMDGDSRRIQLTYTNRFGNNKIKSRSKRKTGVEEDLDRL